MNSNVYAPRPMRSNWKRVIYNVLHDNTAKAMAREQIWGLVPASMHVSHAKKKFGTALSNMVYHGVVQGFGKSRSRSRTYRLATRQHYDKVHKAQLKRQAKRDAKKLRPVNIDRVHQKKRPVSPKQDVLNQLDERIAETREDLNKLQIARDALVSVL